jgi:hypothetical protein
LEGVFPSRAGLRLPRVTNHASKECPIELGRMYAHTDPLFG